MSRSKLIVDRYIECSNKNEVEMADEIRLLQFLFTKLNMLTVSEAAKKSGLSYNGMSQRLKSEKEMGISAGKTTFVSSL